MIRRKEGSILVVTLAFMLVFTLLGFWSIHYSFTQNEIAEKEKASAIAFWMADGAIEMEYENVVLTPKPILFAYNDTPPLAPQSFLDLPGSDYDVYSYEDSCPPPTCTDQAREDDPELPECTDDARAQDPILCDDAERSQDPDLCDPATRVPVLNCTAEELAADPVGLCPCQVNNSCIMLCPCDVDNTCTGRCSCVIAETCKGRCPCELDNTCLCDAKGTCPKNMVGRCPCEWNDTTCCKSWVIKSYGTVNDQSRAIQAKVGQDLGDYGLDKAIETWGIVNDGDCEPNGNATIEGGCEQLSDFTLENTLGHDFQWFVDNVDYTYTNPPNNFDGVVAGITIIYLTGSNKSINITEDKQLYEDDGVTPKASLLIIDTTGVDPGKKIMITIAGNGTFRGILWIIGEAQLVGTSSIEGATFIAGDDGNVTKVSGTTDIYYDPTAIAEAISTFDSDFADNYVPGSKAIISWKEISRGEYDL